MISRISASGRVFAFYMKSKTYLIAGICLTVLIGAVLIFGLKESPRAITYGSAASTAQLRVAASSTEQDNAPAAIQNAIIKKSTENSSMYFYQTLASSSVTASTENSSMGNESASTFSESTPRTLYEVPVLAGKTVLDAMREYQTSGNFSFAGTESMGLGFFVDTINGKENADGFYWFLYINGKSSDTGASQTTLTGNETVEWRYKKSY